MLATWPRSFLVNKQKLSLNSVNTCTHVSLRPTHMLSAFPCPSDICKKDYLIISNPFKLFTSMHLGLLPSPVVTRAYASLFACMRQTGAGTHSWKNSFIALLEVKTYKGYFSFLKCHYSVRSNSTHLQCTEVAVKISDVSKPT